jgi:hypothetical protein
MKQYGFRIPLGGAPRSPTGVSIGRNIGARLPDAELGVVRIEHTVLGKSPPLSTQAGKLCWFRSRGRRKTSPPRGVYAS